MDELSDVEVLSRIKLWLDRSESYKDQNGTYLALVGTGYVKRLYAMANAAQAK